MNNDYLFPLFCGFAVVYAFGMWSLGRWLRSRGYGPQLDALAAKHAAVQRRMDRMRLAGAVRLFGALRTFHAMPLLGSKSQKQQLDAEIARLKQVSRRWWV
jgi:hypothetical protein